MALRSVDARSPPPRSYRLITHKFKVTRGPSLRSVKTGGTAPPRCALHTTTAHERTCQGLGPTAVRSSNNGCVKSVLTFLGVVDTAAVVPSYGNVLSYLIGSFLAGPWLIGTFLPLAGTRPPGPQLNSWLFQPLFPMFHGDQYDTEVRDIPSSSCWKRHSWLMKTIGSFSLNRLLLIV